MAPLNQFLQKGASHVIVGTQLLAFESWLRHSPDRLNTKLELAWPIWELWVHRSDQPVVGLLVEMSTDPAACSHTEYGLRAFSAGSPPTPISFILFHSQTDLCFIFYYF